MLLKLCLVALIKFREGEREFEVWLWEAQSLARICGVRAARMAASTLQLPHTLDTLDSPR
jgi:hypothetical protein